MWRYWELPVSNQDACSNPNRGRVRMSLKRHEPRSRTRKARTMARNDTVALTKSPNRLLGVIFGAVYLLVGLIGLFIASPDNPANTLALNAADNVLHFASAIVLLAVGLGAERDVRRAATAR